MGGYIAVIKAPIFSLTDCNIFPLYFPPLYLMSLMKDIKMLASIRYSYPNIIWYIAVIKAPIFNLTGCSVFPLYSPSLCWSAFDWVGKFGGKYPTIYFKLHDQNIDHDPKKTYDSSKIIQIMISEHIYNFALLFSLVREQSLLRSITAIGSPSGAL